MNKEIKFSRFVGIAIVIICIWVVVLALMSAILKNENNDNMIYVDEGLGINLSIAKSNIISNYIDIDKEIKTEKNNANFNVRLPKINIETEDSKSINDKLYKMYQNVYADILNDNTIQKIDMDYTYEYIDSDNILEITVITKTTKNGKLEEVENKFTYDLVNNKEIIE